MVENLSRNCNGKHPKKTHRTIDEIIPLPTVRWVEHEFFYSFIDSIYFSQNDFQKILDYRNISSLGKMTKLEWNFVRLAMGKPRRFSKNFISSEIDKMNHFRNLVREFLTEKIDLSDLEAHISNKETVEKIIKLAPLNVGQIVLGKNYFFLKFFVISSN